MEPLQNSVAWIYAEDVDLNTSLNFFIICPAAFYPLRFAVM